MKGQDVGYMRVSTVLQNEERQLAELKISLDRVFVDKISGKDRNRPELKNCLEYLREGDTLHVHSIDRLARSLKDLQDIVNELNARKIAVHFYKENLIFTGADDPMSKLMLGVMGACAEFELAMIRERQREGIEAARKKGKQIGRRKSLSNDQEIKIMELWRQGKNKKEIAIELGVSRSTLYSFIAEKNLVMETQHI